MKKPEPVEIVLIAIPVICELIAVCLFITACGVGIVIANTPVTP